jgi:hypothetical protein
MDTKRGGGRIRYSKQEWHTLVSEFMTSGQDHLVFCWDKGLNPACLMRWQGVFRKETSSFSSKPVAFVDLGSLNPPSPQARALELKLDLGGGVVLTLSRH